MKVTVLTLGCRVNQSESLLIEGNLKNKGFSIVSLSEKPDVCIINTCSVTAKSDYQSRQVIRRAVRSGAEVIVTGCYSQLNPIDVRNIDSRITLIQNDSKLPDIMMLFNLTSTCTLTSSSRSRPHVKIQDGCNSSCSYCVVHLARGRSRSESPRQVIEQIRAFADQGYREVVLSGIHLGSYGYDLTPKLGLSDLLANILSLSNIPRIRLSSIELSEIDANLISLFHSPRLCNHIHIPLQSGDDHILKQMNRTYTSDDYLSTVNRIFEQLPGISFGADVIVGFPGEGDREFLNTKSLLESIPISYMHIFPYSRRPATPAAAMPGQVSDSDKKRRFAVLNELNIRKKRAYLESQIGKTLEVVVEKTVDQDTCIGTSANYLRVMMKAKGNPGKTSLNVEVTGTDGLLLHGTPIVAS